MKKNLLIVVFICLSTCYFTQNENNRGYKVNIGDPLPKLKMEMRSGEIWTNNNLKNKVVVLQFTIMFKPKVKDVTYEKNFFCIFFNK